MKHALESQKWFPYIAWTTVICFTFFTGTLVVQLNETINGFDKNVIQLESELTPP